MPPKSKKIMSALKLGKSTLLYLTFLRVLCIEGRSGKVKKKVSMVVTHTLGRTKSDLCCANGPCRSDVWADFTTVCLHNDSFRQFDLQIAATALNQLFFFLPPSPFPLWVGTTVTSFQNTHQNRWCTGWRQGLSFIRL